MVTELLHSLWSTFSRILLQRIKISDTNWLRFLFLLNPFWNHWLSLQSDWLSAVQFIHESHIFFSANENGTVKQNQSDFKASLNYPVTLQENERRKAIVCQI